MPKKTIQVKQAEIRQLLLQFNWETNPKWADLWKTISYQIDDYWKNYLMRDDKNRPNSVWSKLGMNKK
jgi:hypothetical protein